MNVKDKARYEKMVSLQIQQTDLGGRKAPRMNLGYLDPSKVNVDEWKDKEDESILYVPKAGEILYRVKK